MILKRLLKLKIRSASPQWRDQNRREIVDNHEDSINNIYETLVSRLVDNQEDLGELSVDKNGIEQEN